MPALIIAAGALPAASVERAGLSATKAKPVEWKDYPAIQEGFPFTPVANPDWDWQECMDGEWCTAIKVTVNPVEQYGHHTIFRVRWQDDGSGAEIEARVYREDKVVISTLQREDSPPGHRWSKLSLVDLEQGSYWLMIACLFGPCPAQRAGIEIDFEDLYSPPPGSFTPQPSQTQSSSTPTPSTTPSSTSSPMPSPEPVLTPGPDGPRGQLSINALAAGQQATPPGDSVTTIANVILVVLLAAVLGGGGFMVATRIRRDLKG